MSYAKYFFKTFFHAWITTPVFACIASLFAGYILLLPAQFISQFFMEDIPQKIGKKTKHYIP